MSVSFIAHTPLICRCVGLLLATFLFTHLSARAADRATGPYSEAVAKLKAWEAALKLVEQHEASLAKAKADGDERKAMTLHLQLASLMAYKRDREKAMGHLAEVEKWLAANAGRERRLRIPVLERVGRIYGKFGLTDKAIHSLTESYKLCAREFGAYHLRTSLIQGQLGIAWLDKGNFKKAAEHLKDAATNMQQQTHYQFIPTAEIWGEWKLSKSGMHKSCIFIDLYARLLRYQGKLRYERNRLKEYRRMLDRLYGKRHIASFNVILRQAVNAEARKDPGDAQDFLIELVELADLRNQNATVARQFLLEFYERRDKPVEAGKIRREISDRGGTDTAKIAKLLLAAATIFPFEEAK